MNSPAYSVFGIDPDAFCSPEFFDLQKIRWMKDGWLIVDYGDREKHSRGWKDHVASLAVSRYRGRKITEIQRAKIEAWLERNIEDYPMLRRLQDPRFAMTNCEWNKNWGWPRNACSNLTEGVEAVFSAKEVEPEWPQNPGWRQLKTHLEVHEFSPELDPDNRDWEVCRDPKSLASLIYHPLRFCNTLKIIDPNAVSPRWKNWRSTIEAMLQLATSEISIELHCSRDRALEWRIESSQRVWLEWAQKQKSSKLKRFTLYYWKMKGREELPQPGFPQPELHPRCAILGAGPEDEDSKPFAGIEIEKGWDEARKDEQSLVTPFKLLNQKAQKTYWNRYSEQSVVFSRIPEEDVGWPQSP